MSNMVGIGPFITIPLIISAMGGPQCMLGWALGAILALADGLVWAELAAAMPGAGGTYLYLREAFRGTRAGRLLPFLFIWQFIFSGPLEIASGYIGFAQYLSYFWRSMGVVETRMVSLAVGALIVALLYRRITAVGRLTVVLWAGMLAAVVWIIVSGLVKFDARMAFDFPPGAFRFSTGFAAGLGSAMLIAMYDFLGYYDVCYIGGEVREPARVIPRAIIYSVVAVALIYSTINLVLMAVIPWREAVGSRFIVSQFMEKLYGGWAGAAITVLILWCALASLFALVLGYSRIPYAAALDGNFFRVFGRLHAKGQFPHISLLVVGGIAMAASLIDLAWVIAALLAARILVQFVGQVAAVHYLRTRRPDVVRPFRIWLYPLPSVAALVGWLYIFASSGLTPIIYGLVTLGAGVAAYALWDRRRHAARG